MGCDYYVIKLLKITYKNKDEKEIELHREPNYFPDVDNEYDSDEPSYIEYIHDIQEKYLTPKMEPILLYEDGDFTRETYRTKYLDRISDIENVDTIYKIEKRQRRF